MGCHQWTNNVMQKQTRINSDTKSCALPFVKLCKQLQRCIVSANWRASGFVPLLEQECCQVLNERHLVVM